MSELSRRSVLAGAAGGLAAGIGLPAAGADARGVARRPDPIPFHGVHQAGIATPQQDRLHAGAFDVTATSRRDLRELLREWSAAAARMTRGLPSAPLSGLPAKPPEDTGEAVGASSARLTVTFGFGPTLFELDGEDRFGLAPLKPAALVPLPRFRHDQLDPAYAGGDLFVQVCGDDPQVTFHALRTLIRIAQGGAALSYSSPGAGPPAAAALQWQQVGFGRTARTSRRQQTPRNLQGFKDGTANVVAEDRGAMREHVWIGPRDQPAWARGGTYLVTRRIRMLIEGWDGAPLSRQERTVGRHKLTGAPLGGAHEHDPVRVGALPRDSHVRLAHPAGNGGVRILRRGYSFTDGIDRQTDQLDAGLFFISYQRDPGQFVTIMRRLADSDALNQYVRHVGSAAFICPPGARRGGYVGETLLG